MRTRGHQRGDGDSDLLAVRHAAGEGRDPDGTSRASIKVAAAAASASTTNSAVSNSGASGHSPRSVKSPFTDELQRRQLRDGLLRILIERVQAEAGGQPEDVAVAAEDGREKRDRVREEAEERDAGDERHDELGREHGVLAIEEQRDRRQRFDVADRDRRPERPLHAEHPSPRQRQGLEKQLRARAVLAHDEPVRHHQRDDRRVDRDRLLKVGERRALSFAHQELRHLGGREEQGDRSEDPLVLAQLFAEQSLSHVGLPPSVRANARNASSSDNVVTVAPSGRTSVSQESAGAR